MNDHEKLRDTFLASIPKPHPGIISWSEEFVVMPGSAFSTRFNVSLTPWLREPIERVIDDVTRSITFMKPIQSGGSVAGEVAMLYWIMFARGILQYNWSNDKRSKDRWNSRIDGILKACVPVSTRRQSAKQSGEDIDFGNVFLRVQGSFVSDNLDSDTIPLQINEEVHSWEPGHLAKAEGRASAVWNYKRFNISNAGKKNDQLDVARRSGTMQPWAIRCPACKNVHVMRIRWSDSRPELGGLRYDASKARIGRHDYNYNILRPTIHYQMPCGFKVPCDDIMQRRALNAEGSGHYLEPTNPGASLSHRSYEYQAVIVDYIDWMTLIQEKHRALKARALGDNEPWIKYVQERECTPYDPDDVPTVGAITLAVDLRKTREGLVGDKLRFTSLDHQAGDGGENPYWWAVIRDFKVFYGELISLLVYEGRIETDEDVVRIMDEHSCERWLAVADSGDDTEHVYQFCMRYGINAIKGAGNTWFQHPNGSRRIFSPERPLHTMVGMQPKFPYIEYVTGGVKESRPDDREPLFWLYSKGGIREKLNFLRASTDFQTPADVSEDYKAHNEAETRVKRIHARTGQEIIEYVQLKRRNDLYVCEAYIAMQMDMSGMVVDSNIYEVGTENKTK